MGRGVIRAEILSFSQARRTPQAERPHSLGCYNPVMEDAVSYATLSFPLGETDTQRLRYQGVSPAPWEGHGAGLPSCLPFCFVFSFQLYNNPLENGQGNWIYAFKPGPVSLTKVEAS